MIPFRNQRVAVGAATVAALLALSGCDRQEARTYRAPKDQPTTPVNADPHAGMGMGGMGQMPSTGPVGTVPEVVTPPLNWTLPAGWQELPAGQMRVGHFAINGDNDQKAQVTIIPLGGMGGGDLENVNRWRGQVSLPRITQEEMDRLAEAVEIGGAKGQLFDFAGETPDEQKKARLMAAVLHRDGTAWFFKFMGDDALVAAQKPVFVEFLKTISFGAMPPDPHGSGAGGMMAGAMPGRPAGGGGMAGGGAGGMAAAKADAGTRPAWELPAGWQETSPGPMQMARFAPPASEGAKAEVTVVMLPGDAGGMAPNVNRWRGQVGLAPLNDADLTKQLGQLDLPGATTYLIDAANEQTKRRVVAAGVTRGGSTWFYKLIGDEAAVAAQKEAFLKFIQTVKYGS